MPKEFGKGTAVVRICTGATCDVCGARLEASMGTNPDGHCSAFQNALYVTVSGPGYGELLDGEPDREAIFCGPCAEKFMRHYPIFWKPDSPRGI